MKPIELFDAIDHKGTPQAHADTEGWVRERDDQYPASTYDTNRGCHVPPPPPPESNRAKAEVMLTLALQTLTDIRNSTSHKDSNDD